MHAGGIYQTALPNLASALKKAAIEKRLAEIASLKPIASGIAKSTPAPTGPTATPIGPLVLADFADASSLRFSTIQAKYAAVKSDGGGAIQVTTDDKAEWPTLVIAPKDGKWDLSGFDAATVDLQNPEDTPVGVHMNLDNPGSDGQHRCSSNGTTVPAHGKATLTVRFGHWFGDIRPFDPANVVTVSVGVGRPGRSRSFLITRIEAVAAPPAPNSPGSENSSVPPKFELNQWVDVLRLMDTSKNVIAGTWSRRGADLTVAAGQTPRIAIPVSVDGSYDFSAEFTRTSGKGDVAAMLSVAGHPCVVNLSAVGGAMSGLQNIDGHGIFADNPIVVKPGYLENDRYYRLSIKVRILSTDRASIGVVLDGKPYLPLWEGNPARLSASKFWPMPNPKGLGLGAQESDVTFHAVRLRMLSGNASLDGSAIAPAGGAESRSPAPHSVKAGVPLGFTKWAYKSDETGKAGSFEKRGSAWVEVKEGKDWSRFVEVARTPEYVEIKDPSRGVFVRLTPTKASWSRNRSGWLPIAEGKPAD